MTGQGESVPGIARDLERLARVHAAGATEAVVFYAARVLEARTRDALVHLGSRPSGNLFGNLLALEGFDAFPKAIGYFAHAVRRAGNEARHLGRDVGTSDAEVAVALLARFLGWHDRQVPGDPELATVPRALVGLDRADDAVLGEVLDALARHDLGALGALWGAGDEAVARSTPVLAALYADLLLDAAEAERALAVVDRALGGFPRDLRLRQLSGLALSRQGRLEEAVRALEALHRESPDDEETAGILGGALKRLWVSDPAKHRPALERAHRVYERSWRKSESPWTGTNAATTALFLGDAAGSREIAAQVREQLQASLRRLGAGAAGLRPSYWDAVSLAELDLLTGEREQASRAYREAMLANARNRGAIGVTRDQLARILGCLGVTGGVDRFLGAIVLGVTGHRRLAGIRELRAAVAGVLDRLPARLGRPAEAPYHLISPLADGADRLVAECVLVRAGSTLEVLLPLPEAEYLATFRDDRSRARYRELAAQAIAECTLPAARSHPEAYEAVGRAVADRCDVLVALWDGGPSKGRGGTAEIVAYARERGKPLVWVRTAAPGGVEYERLG